MKRSGWWVLALVAMVLCLAAAPAAAQDGRAPRAALLVVDAFEPDGTPPVYADQVQGRACAVEVKGQDGFIRLRGPKPLRSARQPANDQPFPLAHPHGVLVMMHIRDLLTARGFAPGAPLTTADNLQAELWSGPEGEVLVYPVDTRGFTLSEIGPRLLTAVDEVRRLRYEDIVVNMSFAIIPCSNMPVLSMEQYQLQLGEWNALRLFGDNLPDTPLDQVVVDLGRAAHADAELAQAAGSDGKSGTEQSQLAQEIVRLREAGGSVAAALAVLHTSAMQRQIESALLSFYGGYDAGVATALPNAGAAIEAAEGRASSRQMAAASDEGPAAGVLDDLASFGQTLNALADEGVALVASAGNDGLAQPYYPAAYDGVLAVSADYSLRQCPPGTSRQLRAYLTRLGFSRTAIAQQIAALYGPLSNNGEVQAEGVSGLTPSEYLVNPTRDARVLGCLTGTSYAAPDVSVQMAVYFLQGGTIDCSGSLAGSRPPLDHMPYDNLDVPEAALRYCTDFP